MAASGRINDIQRRIRARSWVFTQFVSEEGGWDPNTIDWTATIEPKQVICGLERGKKGRLHWQGCIFFNNQVTLSTVKTVMDSNNVHLEIKRGNIEQAIKYCLKSETAELDEDNEKILYAYPDIDWQGRLDEDKGKSNSWKLAMEAPTYSEGIEILKANEARSWLLYGDRIAANLRHHWEMKTTEERSPKEYKRPFADKERLSRKSILLLGQAGTGKTTYAMDHFKHPLLIRHMDGLKKITPDTDGLVFDDLSFHHWKCAQSVIHLCDLENDSEINVKHSTVTIPKHMPRIFTCNRTFDEWVPEICKHEEKMAIKRRCDILIVHNSLF
ncbi:replication-associated protein [Water beetle associated circular virus 1]|uniref:replication-associated protein n=1 Tax=Water beetle associated circular virus 1 TaxID=2293309 RepID=UPI000E337E54|nr:replication-associated protein [Water beetle associated circular virus 1]AXL65915.1 replication-associated protein [Water beetle associated circular virus 1]